MADQDTDKQILDLQTQLESVKKENAQLKTATVAKDKALEDYKTTTSALQAENTSLKKESEVQKTALAAKDKDLEQAATAIGKLKTQLAEKELETVKLPTVKVGGKSYELVGGNFMYAGKEVSIELLTEDSTLAAELVKERVGNLRLLEAKK